ncbi:hypothetical protein WJX73_009273 [Symbiochloris irregularis]|uniref:Major facilitator superfamily (MFS) profile domain-containing protein n=1 Tax=Symbiochloris irregularis TaxID=706552 RepID=A0AAW1PR02_9CHLO
MQVGGAQRHDVSIDEALTHGVGEFGRGQLFIILQVGLAWVPAAAEMFVAASSSADATTQRFVCSSAQDEACKAVAQHSRPDLCSLARSSWQWSRPGQSVALEWDLICSQAWMVQLPIFSLFFGQLLGFMLFAELADVIGRRRALMAAAALAAVSGAGSALAGNLWWYMCLRACTGLGIGGVLQASLQLASEPVGPNWRAWLATLMHCVLAAGGMLLALLAWLLPGWRLLAVVTSLIMLLFMIMVPSFPESPQWLLAIGRKGEATAALAEIASRNKGHLPEVPLQDMGQGPPVRPLTDILSHTRVRRRLVLSLVLWPCTWALYIGLTLMVAVRLDGSAPLNLLTCFGINAAAVAVAAPVMERLGRSSTAATVFVAGGVLCLLSAFSQGLMQRLVGIAAQTSAAVAVSLLYACSSGLFPTSVRVVAMRVCTLAGNVGAVLAPGVAVLAVTVHAQFVPWIPLAAASFVAAAAALALPESLGMPHADAIQDMAPPLPRRKLLPLHQLFKTKSTNLSQLHGYFMRLGDTSTASVDV